MCRVRCRYSILNLIRRINDSYKESWYWIVPVGGLKTEAQFMGLIDMDTKNFELISEKFRIVAIIVNSWGKLGNSWKML